MKKEEKAWKVERDKVDHDQAENKKANKNKQQQPQDLRGFFQGGALESEKKGVRHASVYLDLALVDLSGVSGGHLVQLQLKSTAAKSKYTSASPQCTWTWPWWT